MRGAVGHRGHRELAGGLPQLEAQPLALRMGDRGQGSPDGGRPDLPELAEHGAHPLAGDLAGVGAAAGREPVVVGHLGLQGLGEPALVPRRPPRPH
ncbi:MAG: hypothetical protein ACK55I_20280, partial [bacterium]